MYSKTLLLLFFVVISFLSSAQIQSATLIQNGDTSEIDVMVRSGARFNIQPERMQAFIHCYHKNGKHFKLYAEEGTILTFRHGGTIYVFEGKDIPFDYIKGLKKYNSIFLRTLYKGDVSLYVFYEKYYPAPAPNQNTMTPIPSFNHKDKPKIFLIEKKKSYLDPIPTMRKKLAKYFINCPELSDKILAREFPFNDENDMTNIVEFYDSNCN